MSSPLSSPKRVAQIVRRHLLRELGELQQRILIVERFGENAVPWPEIQLNLKAYNLVEMMRDHDDYVEQIKLLTKAIDAANEADIVELVAGIKARRAAEERGKKR